MAVPASELLEPSGLQGHTAPIHRFPPVAIAPFSRHSQTGLIGCLFGTEEARGELKCNAGTLLPVIPAAPLLQKELPQSIHQKKGTFCLST